MTKSEKLIEKVIDYTRTTKKDGNVITRTRKIWTGIRNGVIRVQVYSESEESAYPLLDYEVAL